MKYDIEYNYLDEMGICLVVLVNLVKINNKESRIFIENYIGNCEFLLKFDSLFFF